jgi:hypothetical protein
MSPLPNLIHPIDVKIQQINIAATIYDEETREPIQKAARSATTTVKGQILWGKSENLKASAGGSEEQADGYVLFRYKDLIAKSIVLQLNDRFIKMGHVDTDVYITSIQPLGHYPDQNGPALVKAYFQDRQPSKQGQGLG